MRKFSSLAIYTAVSCAIGFGAANAAVTVLGTGPSVKCYQAAEFGSDPADGIKLCTEALTDMALSHRDKAATYVNRGILRSRLSDNDGALADYNLGLSTDSSLAEAYVDRGAIEIFLKDYDAAKRDLDQGITMNANQLEIAYYDRAIVNEMMGNVRGAYEDYRKAVELNPDFKLANEQLMRFRIIRKTTNGT